MKFTYETQGAITYLVCALDPAEQVDSLTLGMLTNNHIAGFAPVLYTEMNGQRYLKYNISAKISVEQFFGGMMNKQRALTAIQNILNTICSADEYMIEQNCISVAPEHIYLNVSSCETALLCIPVNTDKNINVEVAALFKKIIFSTQFDNSEDVSYITQLITYLNNGAGFTVYGFKDLVTKLQSGAAVVSAAHQQNFSPNQPAAVPVSSFDSTISIDDMPGMMGQNQSVQPQMHPPIQPQPQPQSRPQMPPQQMGGRSATQQPPAAPMGAAGRPIPGGAPQVNNQVPPYGVPGARQPQQKPPMQKGPGFAIPGQPMGAAPQPPVPAGGKKQPQGNPGADGEKKMSFFGLMAHYNKDNKALYKKQKEEAKAKKAAEKATQKGAKAQVPPVAGGVPGQPPMGGRPPMGAPVQQPPYGQPQYGQPQYAQPQQGQPQYAQPQYQAPRPVPVQNSFNETTVLTPGMAGGETTLLSAVPGKIDPALIRTKSGERISINKPVFRIGKEKSYVDYFIADNTAISRSHANIHTENGEYFIEDTNSTNHTYINGKLINSNVKVKLTNGDIVRLANEDFTFSI